LRSDFKKHVLDLYLNFWPLYIGGVALLIQLWFLLFVYTRLAVYKVKPSIAESPKRPLSVVICARNEEENLKKNLEHILNQDYPDFEVIVVNDCSNDDSEWVLKELKERYSNLNVVTLKEDDRFKHGKKFAVTIGIKAAKHQQLVFTDADCKPSSNQWLVHMSAAFTEDIEIVLGYSPYVKLKGFLNSFIRFETFHTALSYLSHALKGNPYMGVGRNMAYCQDLFFKGKGFASHMHIASDDDDLFVNQAATKTNTTICFSSDSFTYSEPKKTFKTWFNQKRRHVSTAKHYKGFDRFQLGFFFITQFLFFALATVLLAFQHQWMLVTGIVVFRYLFTWISLACAAGKLKEKDVMYWYPFIEIFLIFTQLNVFITNIFAKPVHWK